MSRDLCRTVKIAASAFQNRSRDIHRRRLQLFLGSGTLQLVSMDIPGPLLNIWNGNHYVLVMKSCYLKLAKAVPTFKLIASPIASLLIDGWIMPYDIPTRMLTDTELQFVCKFFESLCAFLGTIHLRPAPYHPRTKAQPGLSIIRLSRD